MMVDRRELGGKNKSNRWWICRALWPRWTGYEFYERKADDGEIWPTLFRLPLALLPPPSSPPSFLYFFPKSRNVVEILLWSKPVSLWCHTRDINGESFPLILECTAGFRSYLFPLPLSLPLPHSYIHISKCRNAVKRRRSAYLRI